MIGLGASGVKGLPHAHALETISSPEGPIRSYVTQTAF